MIQPQMMRLGVRVYCLGLVFGLLAGSARCGNHDDEINVNSRYTVESVELRGVNEAKISGVLREGLKRKIGEKFDPKFFDDLAQTIKEELHAKSVSRRLLKGSNPEQVRVVLEVIRREFRLDAAPSRLLWHSRQGWTGDLNVDFHGFRAGVVTDGDRLVERYSGFRLGYGGRIFTNRVHFGFNFESLHQEWNRSTLNALAADSGTPGIYRSSQNFMPSLTFALTEDLTLYTGFSFVRLEMQYPSSRTEGAHALTSTLRYRRAWGLPEMGRHRVDLSYGLRGAGRPLGSDFVYARHQFRTSYSYRQAREELLLEFEGGLATGSPPLFERFVAGNSSALRGWNKFDISPVGGTRIAAGTAEYRHRIGHNLYACAFYDAGSAWDRARSEEPRHSAGVGIREGRHGFYFYVGFPLRDGRADPLFMAGVDF